MKAFVNSLQHVRYSQLVKNHQKLQYATASYQFKTIKPVYYPDRSIELQRLKEQQTSQLIAEHKEKDHLPKHYYYKILGLHKHATNQEIKAAYYTLAKRFHPDSTNACNSQKVSKRFQEISNAYHILTDETKRLEYDQLGAVKNEETFLEKASLTGTEYKVKMPTILNAFGSLRRPHEVVKPIPIIANEDFLIMANQEQKLEITFLESVHGVKRNIDLKYLKKCPQCNGKSQMMAGRSSSEPCRKCNGSGHLKKKTSTYTALAVCDQCQGRRYINRHQCDLCDCRGFVHESNKLTIHVPQGVKTGDMISVEHPISGQKVCYRVNVKESDYYKRMGNNVLTEKYIKLSEAILGGVVKVRGIYDTLDLEIKPGTESHTKITLKGKGIKALGDHIVLLKIRLPEQLTMKQRQLILAFAKTEDPTFDRQI